MFNLLGASMAFYTLIRCFLSLLVSVGLLATAITASASDKNVNLATGDVSFPVNLASLPGNGGLSFDLNLLYSSNVKNIVDTWNLEAPTGLAGLGWTLPVNKIIRNTNSTGTFDDDEFYLLDNNVLNRFVQTSCLEENSDDVCVKMSYQTIQYQPWKIEYDRMLEQWSITTEDGFKHVYGGVPSNENNINGGSKESLGNSVEWNVQWGNWLGTSVQEENQIQYASAWNIAYIENTWGQQLAFSYEQSQEGVGPAGNQYLNYSQSVRLSEVTDPSGYRLQLSYQPKLANEYHKPHITPADLSHQKMLTIGMRSSNNWDRLTKPDPSFSISVNDVAQPQCNKQKGGITHTQYSCALSVDSPDALDSVKVKIKDENFIGDDTTMFNHTFDDVTSGEKPQSCTQRNGTGDCTTEQDKFTKVTLGYNISGNRADPNAYQDRLGTHYLDKVSVYNGQNLLYTTQLDYLLPGSDQTAFLGSDQFAKRLLTGIRSLASDGEERVPERQFTYWGQDTSDSVSGVTTVDQQYHYDVFNGDNGALYGALKNVTLPTGGDVTYYYEQNTIDDSKRRLPIPVPEGSWSNPKVYWGSDYVVVTRQGSGQIHLSVYQWVGYWKNWLPSVDGIITTEHSDKVKVDTQTDSFAITTSDGVSIYHKNMLSPGEWNEYTTELQLTLDKVQLATGDRFVVVLDEEQKVVNRFTWTGNNYDHVPLSIEGQYDTYGLTARNNYFLVASASSSYSPNPRLDLYHLSNDDAWNHEDIGVSPDYPVGPIKRDKSEISLSAGNTFATFQVSFEDYMGNPTYYHYIIQWSSDYSMSSKPLQSVTFSTKAKEKAMQPPALITDGNNLVTLTDQEEPGLLGHHERKNKKYTYRFNGVTWIHQDFDNDSLDNNFWGYDSITTTEDGEAQYRQYDPNYNRWLKRFPPYEDGNPTLYQKVWSVASSVEMVASLVLSEAPALGEAMLLADLIFMVGDFQAASLAQGGSLSGMGRYFTGNNKTYYLLPDGTWQYVGKLMHDDTPCKSVHGCIPDSLENQSIQNASTFVSYVILKEQTIFDAKYVSKIRLLKNGKFYGGALNLPSNESLHHHQNDTSNLIGSNAFISYELTDGKKSRLKNASKLYLYRVDEDNFSRQPGYLENDATSPELMGALQDFTVSHVQVNTGTSSIYTHYEYELDSALMSVEGNSAIYNQVTVVPSGSTPSVDKSNGFVTHYFLNGNPNLTVTGDGTLSPYLSTDTVQQCDFDNGQTKCDASGDVYLSSAQALKYYTQYCEGPDDNCQEVAHSRHKYNVYTLPLEFQQYKGVFTRPWLSSNNIDDSDDYSTTTEYNPYGFPSSTSSTQYNLKGDAQTFTTNYTYIQDAYTDAATQQQLQDINLISPLVQSVTTVYDEQLSDKPVQIAQDVTSWKDWDSNSWAPYQHYVAKSNNPGSFDWSNNSPMTSDNWIRTSKIIALNTDYGVVTESKNVDDVYHSVIFDSEFRFPVATFTNARTNSNEAGYFGFEGYEDQETWDLDGSIGQSLTHTGKSALSGTGQISIHPTGFTPVDSEPYLVSAWVKPTAGESCGLGFGSTEVLTSDHTKWQYLEVVTLKPDSGHKPLVECPNGGFIDDVRFGPTSAPFTATIYDSELFFITETLGNNSDVLRYVYNQQQELITLIGPNDKPISTTTSFFSRDSANDDPDSPDYDSYDVNAPNTSVSLAAREEGIYFNFLNNTASLWQGGTVANGVLSLSGSNESRFIGIPAQNAATRVRIIPDATHPSSQISISVGNSVVQYTGNNNWELWISGDRIATANADLGQDWLFITVNRAAIFYLDGKQLFNEYLPNPVSGKSLTLSVIGANEQSTSFDDVMVMSHPIITTAYSDGLGNTLQQQILENDTTTLANATLYDALGRGSVATKPTRITSTEGVLTYQPDLAILDWDTGVMTGDVAAYYGDGGDGFSNDEGFPYTRQVIEQSPLSRPIAIGLPGNDFAYHPVNDFESQIPDAQNITEYDYGIYPSSLFDDQSIASNNPQQYHVSTQYTPWSTPQHIPTTTINDFTGQPVAQKSGSGELTATSGYQNSYDTSGNSHSVVYSPNYYANNDDSYVRTLSHNVLGELTGQTTPDNHQTQYQYDNAGRIRFLMDANGDAQSPNHVLYWKYDKLGRVSETGYFEKDWSTISDSDLQNSSSYPSTPNTWRQAYHYDDNGQCDNDPESCSENLKGRLFSVSINTDNDKGAEANESYQYDDWGRISSVINSAHALTDDISTISYSYDLLGNVLAIDYGENPEQADLQNNVIVSSDLTGDTSVRAVESIVIAPSVSASDDSTTTLHAGNTVTFAKNFTVDKGADFSASVGHSHYVAVYGYNQLGQLISIGTSKQPSRYASYTYNANGSINTEKLNNDNINRRYHYNSPGWLSKIDDSYFTQVLSYKQNTQPERYNASNIANISYTFNNDQDYPDGKAPSDYQVDYNYDVLGRLLSADVSSSSNSSIDQYDVGVSTPLSYDVNGNITNLSRGTSVASNYTYYDGSDNTGPNQVKTSTDGSLYCYDNNGNMIGRSTDCSDANSFSQTINYDSFSQLAIHISSGQTSISLAHGIGTKRISKVVSGDNATKTLYLNGLGVRPLIERTQSEGGSSSSTYYIYGPNGLIATNDAENSFFYSSDHLGSTRVVSKGSNSLVKAYYNYMPFGELMKGMSGGSAEDKFSYRYTGQEYDSEIGLYNYRARIYDPNLARFYATDPVQQGFGPYTYVSNNPIMYVDPTGLVKIRVMSERVSISGSATIKKSKKYALGASYQGAKNIKRIPLYKNSMNLNPLTAKFNEDWLKGRDRHRLIALAHNTKKKQQFRFAIRSGIGAGNKNQQAAHTERKVIGMIQFNHKDDQLLMVGREPPCKSCQGFLKIAKNNALDLNNAFDLALKNSETPKQVVYYSYYKVPSKPHANNVHVWTKWGFNTHTMNWDSSSAMQDEINFIEQIIDSENPQFTTLVD